MDRVRYARDTVYHVSIWCINMYWRDRRGPSAIHVVCCVSDVYYGVLTCVARDRVRPGQIHVSTCVFTCIYTRIARHG